MEEQIISFLKEQFTKIESEFTFDLIQCEVDYLAKIVSVEATPAELFNDNEFKEAELDIILEFKSKFPDFDICFFSNEKVLKIKKPITIIENLPHIEWSNIYQDLRWTFENNMLQNSGFFIKTSFSFGGSVNLTGLNFSFPSKIDEPKNTVKFLTLEISEYAIAA